jgi:hypothetical protein
MLLVEGTLWPLVVVGTMPDGATSDVLMTVDEERLWSADGLRLALVVPGNGGSARVRQRELFGWLRRNRGALWRRTSRVAFVIEDETLRTCADAWIGLLGTRLSQGDVHTFGALRPALAWLMQPVEACT